MSATLGVVFAAVFVLVAAATAPATVVVERLVARTTVRRGMRATWPRATLALAPVVLATLACIALAAQDPFSGCHCAAHGLHHPHLCLSHPAFGQPLLLPSAGVLALWALLVAPRLVRLGRETLAGERWARAAAALPVERVDGVAVRIAGSGSRGAFTAGALAPVIVVGRELWDALSAAQRRAVLHHEHAHVERRDGLTLLALRVCQALSPVPLAVAVLAFGAGLLALFWPGDALHHAIETAVGLFVR